MKKKVYTPDIGTEIVMDSKKYVLLMGVCAALIVISLGIFGLTLASSQGQHTMYMIRSMLAVALVIGLVYLEFKISQKFVKISKAMRTALVVDNNKLTIMECANRQKANFDTFNGTIMYNARTGINSEDLLATQVLRKGIATNNESLANALDQAQDEEYILMRYENRGNDFKYIELSNPKLIKYDDKEIVLEGEKLTLQGLKTTKYSLPNIFPELDKAV